MDAVVNGRDIKISALNNDVTQCVVIVVFGMEAVIAAGDGDVAVRDGYRIICFDGILCAVDLICAA